jgi:hypothetical protein
VPLVLLHGWPSPTHPLALASWLLPLANPPAS